jgi:serine protease inhibitor
MLHTKPFAPFAPLRETPIARLEPSSPISYTYLRMRNALNFGVAALAVATLGCGGGKEAVSAVQAKERAEVAAKALATDDAGAHVDRMNEFAFRLLDELAEDGQNLFVSPLSVWTALSMTLNGAAGETERAMAEALGTPPEDLPQLNAFNRDLLAVVRGIDPKVRVDVANSIWARQGVDFEADFLGRNRDAYAAEIRTLDFAAPDAPKTINSWVSEKTNARIPEIVERIDPDTVMYLINAVYFHGKWSAPFDKQSTRDMNFQREDGGRSRVPMMHRTGEYGFAESEGTQLLSMPYGDGRFRMIAVLPPEGTPVRKLAAELDAKRWKELTGRMSVRQVQVAFPRFRMEYEEVLNDALMALGMGVAFAPGAADFTRMRSAPPPLYISQVRHKSFVEVDEEGTEAAAVTSVEMRVTSAEPAEPPRFIADRPFLFAIVDGETGAILFLGTVADPVA